MGTNYVPVKKVPKIVIFRSWITDKDGNRVYAKDKGLRAWRLEVPVNN